MVQLLHKMKIKAGNDGSTTLLKVVKNPFSQHLPPGTSVYGMTCEGALYSPEALARAFLSGYNTALATDKKTTDTSQRQRPPVCFVIGAISSGHVTLEDYPYIDKMTSVSEYPLSGAAALSRILMGIEQHWGIV
jgi:rRNA small subunit pseudouridine methyltransferase Nep1